MRRTLKAVWLCLFAAPGIVAAQSRKAAEVGAAVLAAGGDCMDAVVATGFALGVVEPWMNGPGGGGCPGFQNPGGGPATASLAHKRHATTNVPSGLCRRSGMM